MNSGEVGRPLEEIGYLSEAHLADCVINEPQNNDPRFFSFLRKSPHVNVETRLDTCMYGASNDKYEFKK